MPDDLLDPVYCPNCKAEISPEADYCPHCGAASSLQARMAQEEEDNAAAEEQNQSSMQDKRYPPFLALGWLILGMFAFAPVIGFIIWLLHGVPEFSAELKADPETAAIAPYAQWICLWGVFAAVKTYAKLVEWVPRKFEWCQLEQFPGWVYFARSVQGLAGILAQICLFILLCCWAVAAAASGYAWFVWILAVILLIVLIGQVRKFGRGIANNKLLSTEYAEWPNAPSGGHRQTDNSSDKQ